MCRSGGLRLRGADKLTLRYRLSVGPSSALGQKSRSPRYRALPPQPMGQRDLATSFLLAPTLQKPHVFRAKVPRAKSQGAEDEAFMVSYFRR